METGLTAQAHEDLDRLTDEPSGWNTRNVSRPSIQSALFVPNTGHKPN